MSTGRATKKAKKMQNMFDYFHKKVEQVEQERNYDRTKAISQGRKGRTT